MKEYWDTAATEFDTYYRREKDALRRIVDKVFRKNMAERVRLTLQECKNVDGKRILDVGCGSGRIAIELARRGAYVTGIDFSKSMLHMASATAKKFDVENSCEFVNDDFLNYSFAGKFDTLIALGFFDYTKDPTPYLKKMKSLMKEKCIFSFPSKFAFQVPLRMIWLKTRKLPVYFYTKKQMKRFLSPIFPRFKIKNISAGYFVVALASAKR
ncbi:MAG: class I SAM-dependent methyltransferase [Candidatus Bathyarchaeota archaeon]|jgi:magnesium protoporphyrin O-methyltransferase